MLKRRNGFTFVEVMVVVVILAVLAAILIPRFMDWLRAREESRAKKCQANMAQIMKDCKIWNGSNTIGGKNNKPLPHVTMWCVNPKCPSGGDYSLGKMHYKGKQIEYIVPVCSKHGEYDPLREWKAMEEAILRADALCRTAQLAVRMRATTNH